MDLPEDAVRVMERVEKVFTNDYVQNLLKNIGPRSRHGSESARDERIVQIIDELQVTAHYNRIAN